MWVAQHLLELTAVVQTMGKAERWGQPEETSLFIPIAFSETYLLHRHVTPTCLMVGTDQRVQRDAQDEPHLTTHNLGQQTQAETQQQLHLQ